MPIFHNRAQQLRVINNTLYLIQAILPIEQITRPNDMKEYLGSDIAFRVANENAYYFCKVVPEAEYEEIQ